MDVQNSRNFTQMDRLLLEKHGRGDHAPCDEVPNVPDISPILPTWNAKRAQVIVLLRLPYSVVKRGC